MKTPSQQVLEYYPDAKPINVGSANKSYYEIWSGTIYLGKGKSKKNAWKAASRNINYE